MKTRRSSLDDFLNFIKFEGKSSDSRMKEMSSDGPVFCRPNLDAETKLFFATQPS